MYQLTVIFADGEAFTYLDLEIEDVEVWEHMLWSTDNPVVHYTIRRV